MQGKLIPFTEGDEKSIIDKFASGTSVRELAVEYYCADVRIKRVLVDAGLRLKGAQFTREHREDIANRYVAGEDVRDIAKAYRCRFYTMRDLINSLGVERRVIATSNTPIERRLHDALMKCGIGFTTQVRLVDRYIVDIKVNQAPVVIEADGTTYHRQSERDAERDRAHAEAGYRVFRFTGSEINCSSGACIQRVVDECGLIPDESPVYDIRTVFAGADHPRWKKRLTLKCLNCESEFEVAGKYRHRKFCQLPCYHEYVRTTGIFLGGQSTHRATRLR